MSNIKIIGGMILGFFGLIILISSWVVVSPSEKVIIVRVGSIDRTLDSGLHFKAPIIESAITIDTSDRAIKGTESTYSKDSQTVTVEATTNVSVDTTQIETVYKSYKTDYDQRVIAPSIKEAIKQVFSKYTAQGIIDNRAKLSSEIKDVLVSLIASKGFTVSGVTITNIDFDDSYENAVKEKQIAEQNALKAINVTKSVEEAKKQDILKAEALAEKTKLEAVALQSAQGEKLIDKLYAEAALEAAKKWNGVLPQQMIPGGTLPFISVGK
jgi:regulator of protease activity HflC (stomatin/prohibitin superfamily)